jgi:N-acyl-D-amino-acid deacylase
MVRALIVVDPEVKIDEPVDFSNAPPYISRALAHGKPGWSVTRSNIDQMNAIMKIMDEDLRAARSGSASASPIWP